eukprot:TRINITY_DN12959_c0_g1_i1.p1 TRINITY_DN12959_c0_g1~~TRINITY_DN12959_c0_g1_i1.p1  ORF type:complete len:424 (+),score=98.94 TRINITY_DN12959_c0_g1_i1:143-1414(+)
MHEHSRHSDLPPSLLFLLEPILSEGYTRSSNHLDPRITSIPRDQLNVVEMACRFAEKIRVPKNHWRPDKEVKECMYDGCGLRFSILQRRHHCRRCGNIFCADHSSRQMYLNAEAGPALELALGGQKCRVCDMCFQINYAMPPNEAEKRGRMLLEAAWQGEGKEVLALLKKGVDVNTVGVAQWTSLHLACKGGFADVADVLLQHGAKVDSEAEWKTTPLHIAAAHGNNEIVSLLVAGKANLNSQNEDGNTPLHRAACHGRATVCETLLKNGADASMQDNDGNTALTLACAEGQLEVVPHLVRASKTADILDKNGNTPLFWAVRSGNFKLIRFLVENGANVNAKNKFENTPLHIAFSEAISEIAQVLIEAGANPEAKNLDGQIPLEVCPTHVRPTMRLFYATPAPPPNTAESSRSSAVTNSSQDS